MINLLSTSLFSFLCLVATPLSAQVEQSTVPLLIEGNRPFIDISLGKPEGSKHSARFLVDSGGGGFLLTESLARDLGLTWETSQREEGKEFAVVNGVAPASVGDFSLELQPDRVFVVLAAKNILPESVPGQADGMLPGHVLARYHVVFDYPRGQFTIARPGVLMPKGDAMPMPVSKKSGFPTTAIEVNGGTYDFLLDTGGSFTMVSETLLKKWGSEHPEWERHEGAFGEAKWLGGQTLETMFIPQAKWGANTIPKLGVTSQREGTFERYMSSMTKKPVVGALAGNVLKQVRIELDYKNETVYVSIPSP